MYTFINKIREASKRVEVEDVVNGEVKTYPSIYACGKALNANPGSIHFSMGDYTIMIIKLKF